MKRIIGSILVTSLFLGAGVASAEARKGNKMARHAKIFAAVDTDGDGRLSQTEIQAEAQRRVAKLQKRMQAADTDRDGYVTKEELAAHHAKFRAERKAAKEAKRQGK